MTWGARTVTVALISAGCAAGNPSTPTTRAPAPRLFGASGEVALPEFTAEEQARDVAVKTLRRTDRASHHVVRLLRAEPPHTHELSDLTVTVLSGPVDMHLGDQVFPVLPGDVIDIPRGTPHWAENMGDGPAYAYAVFSPALHPEDRRPVPPAPPR